MRVSVCRAARFGAGNSRRLGTSWLRLSSAFRVIPAECAACDARRTRPTYSTRRPPSSSSSSCRSRAGGSSGRSMTPTRAESGLGPLWSSSSELSVISIISSSSSSFPWRVNAPGLGGTPSDSESLLLLLYTMRRTRARSCSDLRGR